MTDTPYQTYTYIGLTNTTFPEYRYIISQQNNYYSNYKQLDYAASYTQLGESNDKSKEYRGSRSKGGKGGKGSYIIKRSLRRYITRGGAMRKIPSNSRRRAITK